MIDSSTREILSLIAEWLSAVGTVGAVIVALYLSARQNRRSLLVYVSDTRVIAAGQRFKDGEEYVDLSVTNIGPGDAVLAGIMWRVGFFRRTNLIQIPPAGSVRLPHRMPAGETAHFLFPRNAFVGYSEPIRDALKDGWLSRLIPKRIRGGVYLSTGEKFLAKPDRGVLELLRQAPAIGNAVAHGEKMATADEVRKGT